MSNSFHHANTARRMLAYHLLMMFLASVFSVITALIIALFAPYPREHQGEINMNAQSPIDAVGFPTLDLHLRSSTPFVTLLKWWHASESPDDANVGLCIVAIDVGFPFRSFRGFAVSRPTGGLNGLIAAPPKLVLPEPWRKYESRRPIHMWPASRYWPVWPLWPGIVLNAIAIYVAVTTAHVCVLQLRRTVRRAAGRCCKCGYLLVGLCRCPECGESP